MARATIFSTILLLINSTISSFHSIKVRRQILRTKLSLVPADISSTDIISDVLTNSNHLFVPNTSIQSLDGGSNLGAMLWAFVLFNGIGPNQLKPADWLLEIALNVTKSDEPWQRDFRDGYDFICPPEIELVRLIGFIGFGYLTNLGWIALLDGDAFWGWSTALSLCIPTGLLALSRPRRVPREEAKLESALRESFKEFRQRRLARTRGQRCSERILQEAIQTSPGFRRKLAGLLPSPTPYMDATSRRKNEELRERLLRRIVRGWVGYQPDQGGNFANLELLPPVREYTSLSNTTSSIHPSVPSALQVLSVMSYYTSNTNSSDGSDSNSNSHLSDSESTNFVHVGSNDSNSTSPDISSFAR